MTTVDKMNTNTSLLRPTDLSLKGCVVNRAENKTPYIGKYKVSAQICRTSGERENFAETMAHICPPTYVESPVQQSPIALVFPSMAGSACIDPAAKLVVLDSIFSQCKQRAINSSAVPVFGSDSSIKSRSRGSSDSSTEKLSIDHNFSGDLKVKSERTTPRDVRPQKVSPQTPSMSPPGGKRGCKRKGGWKFHDLSDESDGLGRRKRAYSHNRLENEILQTYQDRVIIKEVPTSGSNKDRIVVIEPSFVSDPDLVTSNTALRLILNKKQGTFQLQVLPFTIEQGQLSNKHQVIHTVGRMLGDSGEVLCPGYSGAVLDPVGYSPNLRQQSEFNYEPHSDDLSRRLHSAMTSSSGQNDVNDPTIDKYLGRWKCYKNASPPRPEVKSPEPRTITTTDRLLLTLNKELAKYQQRASAHAQPDATSRCLMWHRPAPSGNKKRALYPSEAKLCAHCAAKLRQKNNPLHTGGRTLKK